MSCIAEIAHMKLYPLGDYSDNTRIDMVTYLKQVFDSIPYSINIEDVIKEWILDNLGLLRQLNEDTKIVSAIDVAYKTRKYNGKSDYSDLVSRIPKSLQANDFIPIKLLITALCKKCSI